MARIQIGTIAYRKPNGDFLPSQPIYRDVPDDKVSDYHVPYDEAAEIFAKKYKAMLAARRLQSKSKNT